MLDRRWSSIAIQACIEHGVDHFFIAPGSRCTPLTLAVAHHRNAIVTQHFDERALAFAALGYTRATGKPGVFICTSGTAVANAFPAVIEASMECVPMLLFTADRPPELRGTGANQTIDQQRIFGDYARWFFDMPCPEDAIGEGQDDPFVYSQVKHAIDQSQQGPVHLNWMFREPFSIEDGPAMAFDRRSDGPTKEASAECTTREPIRIGGNTIVAVGGCTPEEANIAGQLAKCLNAPLVTDITSQLREISPDVSAEPSLPQPQTVVHVGGRIVSKQWLTFTAQLPVRETLYFHLTSSDIRINPNHLPVSQHVGPLQQLASRIQVVGDASSDGFREAWQVAELNRQAAIDRVLTNEEGPLSEPAIAHAVGRLQPPGHGLFLGNSSPIRDFDCFARWPNDRKVHVAANRGASGIDGLVATAVGFAKGLQQPTTAVIGDLSALHDLNSLALVAESDVPVRLLIINNHAGHIFDRLPVAKKTRFFEQYFATPHRWQFHDATRMFGLEHRVVRNMGEFESVWRDVTAGDRSIVIEAITDRQYNMQIRQQINIEAAK